MFVYVSIQVTRLYCNIHNTFCPLGRPLASLALLALLASLDRIRITVTVIYGHLTKIYFDSYNNISWGVL